jgi:hypothetical protein
MSVPDESPLEGELGSQPPVDVVDPQQPFTIRTEPQMCGHLARLRVERLSDEQVESFVTDRFDT